MSLNQIPVWQRTAMVVKINV